jgi:hypothetical protein
MNKNRLLVIVLVMMVTMGLLTVSLVSAGTLVKQDVFNDFLRRVSEETGLVASETAVSPECAYDTSYNLYLCPEADPAVRPQRNPVAHDKAIQLLDTTGLLLIPESTNDRVMAFDPITGDLVDADFIPSDVTNLSTPIHAILSSSGDSILVSDQLEDAVLEYDMAGNFIGMFAGGDTAVLDNVRGIALRSNNNLLVTVAGGANADAIAEFDTGGVYQGNFIANGAGGLDSPFDVYSRASDWLVNAITSDAIHRYDLTGTYIANLTAINTFPEQGIAINNGNILIANFAGTEEGIVEYTTDGVFVGIYNPASLGGYRGVYELPNGNILTTNGSGVHEIDRSGNLVETKITDVNARFIEPINLVEPAIELVKTVGTDSSTCGSSNDITVSSGTAVYYCYTVTNTGNITLTTHDLVDSALGTILDNFSFALQPEASVWLTMTTTIENTTVNTATWTAYYDTQIYVSSTATATVTVPVYKIYLPMIVK